MTTRWRRRHRTTRPIRPPPPPAPEYYSQCWVHHQPEAVAGAWGACPECGHVYATAEDLVDAWNALVDILNAHRDAERPMPHATPRQADTISSCPHCHHDF